MIELRSVRVVFGRTIALDSLDIVLPGGITGVFGPNGSGKSTLLRVVSGLLKPTSGTVSIDGRPLRSSDESLRARIGYAGHDAGLYPRLSLAENLELFAALYGVNAARVASLLEILDLAAWSGTPVGALSAGFKRRAAVARALLHEPDVLLLDEPYANVDDEAADLISQAIAAWRQPDRIGLVATHGGKKVKAYADHGLILKHGGVVVHGTYRQPVAKDVP